MRTDRVIVGGTLDGNGQVWYDTYAANAYTLRPVLVGIDGLKDSVLSDLVLRYSPQYYHFVANASNIVFNNISIAGDSTSKNTAKNTDGWDTYRSRDVTIMNSVVNNADGESTHVKGVHMRDTQPECDGETPNTWQGLWFLTGSSSRAMSGGCSRKWLLFPGDRIRQSLATRRLISWADQLRTRLRIVQAQQHRYSGSVALLRRLARDQRRQSRSICGGVRRR